MNKNWNTLFGIALSLSGILIFLANLHILDLAVVWPLILFVIGLTFILAFYNGVREPSLLFAGFMLLWLSIFFEYLAVVGWDKVSTLWPLFLLAIGCGFLAEYFLVAPERMRLSLGVALPVAATILLIVNHFLGKFWPILLFMLGILLIVFSSIQKPPHKKSKQTREEKNASEETASKEDSQA